MRRPISYRNAENALKPIVINQGEIDRRAWKCALLLKLRDELKAGNLWVRYSKRFSRLEEFFIDSAVGRVCVMTFFAVLICPLIASRYRNISHAVYSV